MEDLIQALQILIKYGNPKRPISCRHDILTIISIDPHWVSKEDKSKLERIGFFVGSDYDGKECFQSHRYA